MPRPKKVTVEKIQYVLKKMKQMKYHQQRKIQIGERKDGQPIYHYPSISKAKVAKALKCEPDYLTSIKDEEIVNALRYVGQKRTKQEDIKNDKPNPNTKAYLKLQVQRQFREIEKLKNDLKKSKLATYRVKEKEKQNTDLTETLEASTSEVHRLRQQVHKLEYKNKLQRTEIAILNSKLALKQSNGS